MTNHSAEQTLRSAIRYIGAYYGANAAHYLLAVAFAKVLALKIGQSFEGTCPTCGQSYHAGD